MNIQFDHQIFSLQEYGGISRYFCELAQNLSLIPGNNVDIYAPFHLNSYLTAIGAPFNSNTRRRTPDLLGFGRYISLAANTGLAYIKNRTQRNIEIFHETYYSGFDCGPANSIRLVTAFDMIHEKFAKLNPGHDRLRQLKASAFRRADHVLCISKSTQIDLMALYGIPEEKTTVVYLGCSEFGNDNISSVTKAKKPFLLFVGQRAGYKNFSAFITAYGMSGRLKKEFQIICFGGGSFTSVECELFSRLELPADSVRYAHGGDDLLADLYRTATALIYPSIYEGFGIPPLEAMSCGCPVICSNTSSLPEVVGDAARTFDPMNQDDILTSIEEVVFSSDATQTLISRGFDRVSLFSWENVLLKPLIHINNYCSLGNETRIDLWGNWSRWSLSG